MPEGVVFDGWYLDFYFKVPAFQNGKLKVTKYEDEMVLYAKYKNLPKLTIELNGGVMRPFNLETVRLGELEDTIDMPYKRGYQFDDFYTDPEFKNLYNYKTEDITEDITIYAKYSKLYVVRFDTKGGKEVGNKYVEEGKEIVYLPNKVEKIGYVFKGWKIVGSDDIYNDYYNVSGGVTSDLSFEAVYEEGYVLKVYKLEYNMNSEQVYVIDKVITISKTCPEEYSFDELCKNLKKMYKGIGVADKIYTNEELTNELTSWPTGNINIYFSSTEE